MALKRLNISYLTKYRHVWYGSKQNGGKRGLCSRVPSARGNWMAVQPIERSPETVPIVSKLRRRASRRETAQHPKTLCSRENRKAKLKKNRNSVLTFGPRSRPSVRNRRGTANHRFPEQRAREPTGGRLGDRVENGLNSSKLCLSFDVTFLRLATERTTYACNYVAVNRKFSSMLGVVRESER